MIGMALIALALSIVALDVRPDGVHGRIHDLVVGVLPMATILAYGILGGGLDLAAGRPTRRHLVGFQAAGWASILIYLAWCATAYDWRDRPLRWLGDLTSRALGGRGFGFDDPGIMAAHMAAFLAPELAAAALGGWMGSRLGIVLSRQGVVRDRQKAEGAGTDPDATGGINQNEVPERGD